MDATAAILARSDRIQGLISSVLSDRSRESRPEFFRPDMTGGPDNNDPSATACLRNTVQLRVEYTLVFGICSQSCAALRTMSAVRKGKCSKLQPTINYPRTHVRPDGDLILSTGRCHFDPFLVFSASQPDLGYAMKPLGLSTYMSLERNGSIEVFRCHVYRNKLGRTLGPSQDSISLHRFQVIASLSSFALPRMFIGRLLCPSGCTLLALVGKRSRVLGCQLS